MLRQHENPKAKKEEEEEENNMISSKCTPDQGIAIFSMYAITIHGSDYTAQ